MRPVLLLLLTLIAAACSTKKAETTVAPTDSLANADSVLATSRANPSLAFSALEGFSLNTGQTVTDSVDFLLIGNGDQFNQAFAADVKGTLAPDFIINYVIGVVCKPTATATTIGLEKVETGESTIDVYITLTRGSTGNTKRSPSQLFAIERREGYPVMQFYVNGKKSKALVLVQ